MTLAFDLIMRNPELKDLLTIQYGFDSKSLRA